jgi:hypothetical protein
MFQLEDPAVYLNDLGHIKFVRVVTACTTRDSV